AVGPVADRIDRGGLDIVRHLRRLVPPQQLALPVDIVIGDLVRSGLLPLLALLDVGLGLAHGNSLPMIQYRYNLVIQVYRFSKGRVELPSDHRRADSSKTECRAKWLA